MPQPLQPASSCSNNHPPDRTSTKHQTLHPPPRQPETTPYRLKALNFHSEVSTTAKPIVRLTLPAINLSTRPAPNPELRFIQSYPTATNDPPSPANSNPSSTFTNETFQLKQPQPSQAIMPSRS
ncbi:hypothetical protein PtA15_12A154 [Puccinia triticina]|uniref:Uncharacterized protein n=1 Tax=Puccinia triticina TaxID=208348 RepID=A0ABY7CZ33_9BASI|nr:uncharacterized protein PtA15_12A154 [Puccinia triticina]WAQ90168.1 hypothetical protein PtA15_12A154 [Puccinia triticina]